MFIIANSGIDFGPTVGFRKNNNIEEKIHQKNLCNILLIIMKLLMCLFFDNCFHINCLLKVVCLGLCMRARWRASNCVRKVIKREEGIDKGSKFAASKKVGGASCNTLSGTASGPGYINI